MMLPRQQRPDSHAAIVRELVEADLATFDVHLEEVHEHLDGGVVSVAITDELAAARRARARAEELLRRSGTPDELSAAIGVLAEGRTRLAQVEAYVVGEDGPADRPPCFFDPAHGPSVTDAAWTTVRFGTRLVPACLQDAALLAAGVRPDCRTVEVDGWRVAYWEAREATAAYLLGYFGGHQLLGWLGNRSTRLGRTVVRPPSGGIKDGFA